MPLCFLCAILQLCFSVLQQTQAACAAACSCFTCYLSSQLLVTSHSAVPEQDYRGTCWNEVSSLIKEAPSTLVQSPPRLTEVLWGIIHPEKQESYHIFSIVSLHPSWSDKGPHFGLAATDLCYNHTESCLFLACNLSPNKVCEEYNPAVGFQLSLSCLCSSFPAFWLPWHFVKWVFIMQTLHSLETRLNLQPYSKGLPVVFTRILSCIQSKKWKWGKSIINPGHFWRSAHRLLLKEMQGAASP